MSWALIADSSCNLRSFIPSASDCSFELAPLKIMVAGKEFIDDTQLDVEHLNSLVAQETSASGTACPSVGEWAELFRSASNVIAITISSQLSGSYEAALIAQKMVMDEAKEQGIELNIAVLDSKRAGGPLDNAIILIDRYLTNNPSASFAEVEAYGQSILDDSQVLFALSSYGNLTKGGRMPKLVGSLASSLSISMLGTASAEGTIKIVGTMRGEKKTIKKILESMTSDGFDGSLVHINHVQNLEGASKLEAAIHELWPSAEIHVIPCGGLCSFYAEQSGLIIGYQCNRA